MIKVLFFARLREQLGCDHVELSDLNLNSANSLTVAELQNNLLQQYPHWQSFFTSSLLVAVNQTMANCATIVVDGDEVAFFPPVTGG